MSATSVEVPPISKVISALLGKQLEAAISPPAGPERSRWAARAAAWFAPMVNPDDCMIDGSVGAMAAQRRRR